nr:pyrethroid hydrolase Ces2a [Biomphalaria glabrata]
MEVDNPGADPDVCSTEPPAQNNFRYTPLTSTGVYEHRENDQEEGRVEYEVHDSYIRTGLVGHKREPCPKFQIIICGLLIFSAVLVGFTFIFVFVILPSLKFKKH